MYYGQKYLKFHNLQHINVRNILKLIGSYYSSVPEERISRLFKKICAMQAVEGQTTHFIVKLTVIFKKH